VNVEVAKTLGFDAIHFTGTQALRQSLVERGILGSPFPFERGSGG